MPDPPGSAGRAGHASSGQLPPRQCPAITPVPPPELLAPSRSPAYDRRRITRRETPLDNLTHALAGAAISKAGLERTTPLATATLVLAANAPDIDMLSYARGPYFALSFRRGITHGWPALLVLPVAVAAAILAWDRWIRKRRDPDSDRARAGPILALSVVGLLTHPTLDWMNTYGMRWGLPFSGAWSYGDALFIVDPWIWLGLGGAVYLTSGPGRSSQVAWGILAVLATSLVLVALPAGRVLWIAGVGLIMALRRWGPRTSGEAGRRLVAAVCGAVALYVGTLVALDGLAGRQTVRAAVAQDLVVTDVMVSPSRGNPFVSEIELVTPEGYVPGTHRWIGTPSVELHPDRIVPHFSGPATLSRRRIEGISVRAREISDVRYYLDWARYPYFRILPEAGEWVVVVSDARYDGVAGAGSLSGLTVRVDETGAP